ncbi:nucleotidyltransferase domain-containing protein [Rhizobium sp. NRK18]|uniref:nucleotidyltransferase domain-containing protein n=1 Tax=Rhizobium sp. NRK18 TaxID=2964667 RepID=UPI0021C3E083|nr:nucleotidyltransferase domain-containing protein [Rhizobium sp. NRK18]MCQ2005259.1 nucleotidyltransferase domain-containing protein [Rhizobium sp. NRK18]
MTVVLPPSIVNISLFGSGARNDNDAKSDLDILVIVENGTGKTEPDPVREFVKAEFGKEPSLSWYGLRKIRALFESGDLFAWHLCLEGKTLAGMSLQKLFGTPADYRSAQSDICDLRGIASRVERWVTACHANAVFELGILYVCARNVAMAASWRLRRTPSFGRYSPFELPIPFPIALETYEKMLQCRMASQRGSIPPDVAASEVLEVQRDLLIWCDEVAGAVAKVEATDEQISTI